MAVLSRFRDKPIQSSEHCVQLHNTLFDYRCFYLEDCIAFARVGLNSSFSEVESLKNSCLDPEGTLLWVKGRVILSHTSENVFRVGLMLVVPYGFNDYVIHIYLQHVPFRRLCSSFFDTNDLRFSS
jgi:hypothetical protein